MSMDTTCEENKTNTPVGDIAASIQGRPINFGDSDSNSNSSNGNAQKIKFSDYRFPTPITLTNLAERAAYHNTCERNKLHDLTVIGLGKDKLISYAAYFCKFEARDKHLEVVSVQFHGNDTIEDEIIEKYPDYFGDQLDKIILVGENSGPKVDFKTVDDLVNERPDVVNNCVLILICPQSRYDMKAISKLKPSAILMTYEVDTQTMSVDLRAFLRRNENPSEWDSYQEKYPGLGKYNVQEIAYQEVHDGVGDAKKNSTESESTEAAVEPETCFYKFRMVKLTKTD